MAAPSSYRAELPDGYPLDALDVILAFRLPALPAMAVKHLLRLGHKPGEPEIADVQKAIVYLERYRDALLADAAAEVTAEPDDDARERYERLCATYRGEVRP